MEDLLKLRKDAPSTFGFSIGDDDGWKERDDGEGWTFKSPSEITNTRVSVSQEKPYLFDGEGIPAGSEFFEVAVDAETLEDVLEQDTEDAIEAILSKEYDDVLGALEYAEVETAGREEVIDAILTRRVDIKAKRELEEEKAAMRNY